MIPFDVMPFLHGENDTTTMQLPLIVLAHIAATLAILIIVSRAILHVFHWQHPAPGSERLPRLPGIPWLGRLWDVPTPGAVVELARHFSKFHEYYGPIYEWQAMGTTRVFINDEMIAHDLLVQQGKLYSDKPDFPATLGMKAGYFLPLMGVGETFTRHRNFVMAMMKNSRLQGFYGHPTSETGHTLRRFLEQRSSDHWSQNLITHCARSAALCAWGSTEAADTLIDIVPPLLKFLSPGGPLPNQLPFLGHLPPWLSPWKQVEAKRRHSTDAAFMTAWSRAVVTMNEDTVGSWVRLWNDTQSDARSPSSKLNQEEAAHAIGTCAFVAIATIGSPLHAFFNAIAFHPSWLGRLQEELDNVCGDRLPCMQDLRDLPVLRAIVKEVFRWRPPIPFGVPHITNQDNLYNGYHIAKGSIIMINQYALSRNTSLYPDPDSFRPERWLEQSWPTYKAPLSQYPDIRDDAAFGHGVRACPGVELARTEIYTLIGSLAWAFDIKRKEGQQGQFVPWYETSPWIITMASNFPVDIRVRSERKAEIIRGLGLMSEDEITGGKGFGDWQGLATRTRMEKGHLTGGCFPSLTKSVQINAPTQ